MLNYKYKVRNIKSMKLAMISIIFNERLFILNHNYTSVFILQLVLKFLNSPIKQLDTLLKMLKSIVIYLNVLLVIPIYHVHNKIFQHFYNEPTEFNPNLIST